MDLSICIASFNTREALERTLRAAVADCSGLTAEWIVVDNGSGDGSAEMVRREFPSAKLVENPANRFFAVATNQAIALSTGRYVLTLNSDAEILQGTLPGLVDYLDTHPDVGAVTTQMYHPDGRLQRTCARFPSYSLLLLDHTPLGLFLMGRRRRLRRWAWYAEWDRRTERAIDIAPGSFILTRQTVLRSVGACDERFRLYFTDDDWCLRLQRAGFALTYLPSGRVIHVEGASSRQIPGLARRIYFEDLRAYSAKYFGEKRASWLWFLSAPTRWGMDVAAALRGN